VKRRGVAAVTLTCLLAAGCGVPADTEPRALDRPTPATGAGEPAPDRFGSAVERLYLVHDGTLTRVVRQVPAARTPEQILHDLLAGPTRAELQDGLSSALSTMPIQSMTVAGRRAVVSLGETPDQGARSDEVLAYGQIVCTLTSQSAEVGTVSFTRAGQPLSIPRGDGSLSTDPLTIADYASLLNS
jgi:sporulation and spore germination protein